MVCFECGKYGHWKENCTENAPATGAEESTAAPESAAVLENQGVEGGPGVASPDDSSEGSAYWPWMLVGQKETKIWWVQYV